MKFSNNEPKAPKEKVAEYQLLQNWLEQNRQRFIAMANLGISQDSDEWKALAAERAEKMKQFIEVSKVVGAL